MVYMENIKQEGMLVSFDGFINGNKDEHFVMTVDLNDSSKSIISIERNHYTSMALFRIMDVYCRKGKLPKTLVAMTH